MNVSTSLKPLLAPFLQPVEIIRSFSSNNLRPDLLAGLTVAIIMLPQAIAYALIVELPPEMGLYTAIVATIVGALWGSSFQLSTGPTNTVALLLLAVLTSIGISPESPDFVVAVGVIAVMVGILQVAMGLARLGLLVNFVSDSVIVGFTAGAGILIMANQLRHVLGLNVGGSPELLETLETVAFHITETNYPSLMIGGGTMVLMIGLKYYKPTWPGLLISMIVAAAVGAIFALDQQGLKVIGQLPQGLPPISILPLMDLSLLGELSTGALAVAAIGLVESTSIARSIASQTGQRLDSNQEFVGQGLANIAVGFFSGFAVAGSFTRSVVNHKAGAQTQFSSIFSAVFVLSAMLVVAPLAAYIPRAALAGALIVIGFGMIERHEMARIWQGTKGDTAIMIATLGGTLFLDLEFAVLIGILISLVRYVIKTSVPKVFSVLPDDNYNHLVPSKNKTPCPQLGIMDILGDLYFGAISHVEQAIRQNMIDHPEQRYLLLRMRGVHHCDISGIHMLESLMRMYREKGGDLYLMRVNETVHTFMEATEFDTLLGKDNFLPDDGAVSYLFSRVLDPAICIYECDVCAFKECLSLPKRTFEEIEIPLHPGIPDEAVPVITAKTLWDKMHDETSHFMIVDVREPREFDQGHIPNAELKPLSTFISSPVNLTHHRELILVCRSGRRSIRAAHMLQEKGFENIVVLQGGMLAWEAAGLLEAVEEPYAEELA